VGIASPPAPALGSVTQPGGLLRFGKSTLIGRLLYETGSVPQDQLAAVERDSRRHGTMGSEPDYALLVDGLEAEREQAITIDVAYRFFSSAGRRFIVADTPGHEQYTRNMATGASTADLAVVLLDASKGLLTQTRRHSLIASLMGIRHIVLAVNKADLIGFEQARFEAIQADNVVSPSARTPWYTGPTLLQHLETVMLEQSAERPFRMPVQWVNRPNADFRGYAGTIASGRLRPGDAVMAAGSGRQTRVARIVTAEGDLGEAAQGDAVTLVLADELDVSRGEVLAAAETPATTADQFQAHLIWLATAPLVSGRHYLFKLGTNTVAGSVTRIRHRIDLNSQKHLSVEALAMNEVGVVNLSLSAAVPFEPYADSRDLGGFIVIDRLTNATAGVGMIDFALRRATNIAWQKLSVDREARAALKGQQPLVVWFTGLSGSGKSTIANLVERELHAAGRHTYMLDGDNVRHGLNRDLGFTEGDRVENIRRVAEVAALMADAGLIVLVSFISPFRAERQMARELIPEGQFIEVFMDTPIEECRRRDPKGLYAKVDSGLIKNFTGIDSPYERPTAPELTVNSTVESAEDAGRRIVSLLV